MGLDCGKELAPGLSSLTPAVKRKLTCLPGKAMVMAVVTLAISCQLPVFA